MCKTISPAGFEKNDLNCQVFLILAGLKIYYFVCSQLCLFCPILSPSLFPNHCPWQKNTKKCKEKRDCATTSSGEGLKLEKRYADLEIKMSNHSFNNYIIIKTFFPSLTLFLRNNLFSCGPLVFQGFANFCHVFSTPTLKIYIALKWK